MTLLDIVRALTAAGDSYELDVPEPERPFRVWVELADRLGFRLCTPRDGRLRFERITPRETEPIDSKLDDPGFVIDFAEALDRIALPPAPRILSLGVNTGDELALLFALRELSGATIVGVDRNAEALAIARQRFPQVTFLEADLGKPLEVGEFDLVIAIATLQSSQLDDRDLLRRITQRHLAETGSVIIAVPNCRVIGGELSHGARMRNFRQPELGLVIKDIAFYRKYLQQHARQVFVTGNHYLLITAVPLKICAG